MALRLRGSALVLLPSTVIFVIINPISGAGRGRPDRGHERRELARSVLARAGPEGGIVDIAVTERAGHARQLAGRALERHADVVFVWGGDGTINEVGSALAFRRVPLAIIRAGSGNGLARELGIDSRPEVAIERALAGRNRPIDAGELGGRLFFNIAGVGFDAHVAELFNRRELGRRGILPYVMLTLRELMTYKGQEYTITLLEETIHMRALLIAIANSSQYGNGARIAPHARPDDGRLDVVAVAPRSPLVSLWELRRLPLGTVAQARGAFVRSIQTMQIASETPMLMHVDGEPFEATGTVEAKVHPGALVLRVP